MEPSLLFELIGYIKHTLLGLKNLAEFSHGKFADKRLGELFYRILNRDIEEGNFILDRFIKYVEITSPVRKKDTVNTLLEDALKRYEAQLEGMKAKVVKDLDKNLPETLVPDEQLRFILDSVLEYAVVSTLALGSIELKTKTLTFQGETREDRPSLKRGETYLEVQLTFTGYKRPREKPEEESKPPTLKKGGSLDLLLRLVDSLVRRNQGVMKLEVDETKPSKSILLALPVERRKILYYRPRKKGDEGEDPQKTAIVKSQG